MPATRLIKFGDTTFPLGTSVEVISRGRTIGSMKRARADGMIQTIGYRNGIQVEVYVPIVKGPLDQSDWRTRRDSLRSMLAQGPSRLHAGFDDRYYRCCEPNDEMEQVERGTGLNRIHYIRIPMIGPDPYEYSTSDESDTWVPASGTGHNVSVGGGATTPATISLTVGGSGLETIAFTVENETTGEEFTLAGDVTAGDVIVVNGLLLATKIGTTDRMDLFEGLFVNLAVGTNSIVVSWSSSSVTSVTVARTPRYE